jgi:hypothetical protein
LTGRKRIAFDNNVHKIAIFSDEVENVKQLNFSLQKFENDNIEFEKKSVLIYIIVYRKKYVLRGLYRIISLSRLTYVPGIFSGILSK